jgi:chromosome segregation ATPase
MAMRALLMDSPADNRRLDDDRPSKSSARPSKQLRARTQRWARLCGELSNYADELRSLRGELTQREFVTAEEERGIERRSAELQRREAELEVRQREIDRSSSEFEQRRQDEVRARLDEMRVSQVNDRRFLRAAKVELRAKQRLNDAEALFEQYDCIDAELSAMAREIDSEFAQFAAEIDDLCAPNPA